MKKSFWGVMLTLAALVMMLGASSVAFANPASGDIVLSMDVGSLTNNTITSTKPLTIISGESVDKGTSITTLTADSIKTMAASGSIEITVNSVDEATKNWTLVLSLDVVSLDSNATKKESGDVKTGFGISADIVSAAIIPSTASASIVEPKFATINRDGKKDLSLKVEASADVGKFSIGLFVFLSNDTTSFDYAFVVNVSPDNKVKADKTGGSGNAFTSAYFSLSTDISGATISPISFDIKKATPSQRVTLSSGLAGKTISFDISSDVKLISVKTGTVVASSDTTKTQATVTAPTAAVASADYVFKFASGDANGSFDVTVKLVIDSSSTTTADYGSFTLTPANATSTTAVSVVSTDYKGKLCASADATATALTKSGSFTAEDVTTFTLTFAATAGTDGSISIADVYDVSDTSDIVSVSDDVLKSNVITPAVAGSYRILFKATPTDDPDAVEYFTVNFSLAASGSDEDTPTQINDSTLTDSSKAVSDFNSSESGAVSESDIAALDSDTSIEGRALKAGYADFFTAAGVKTLAELLAHVPTTGGFTYPQYALMKLTTAPAEGDTIIVRLMTASAIGANPTSSSTTYAGTFVSKAASQYIIIDTYNLRQPSTPTSTLTLPEGIYAILAQIYTSASTESVSIAATADGMAKLAADGYSGNVASKITGSNKGSSSGCDAGFGALALLALALPLVKKFSK